MIFCEECGTKLPEGTTKCPNCGAVVNAVNTETNNIDISKDSSKAAEQAQQNSAPQNEASQAANEQNAQQYQQQTYAQQPYAQPMYQNYQQPQQPYNYAPNLAYNMPQMHGLVLADEFSQDTCRLHDANGKSVDKDIFRKGGATGEVSEVYNKLAKMLQEQQSY